MHAPPTKDELTARDWQTDSPDETVRFAVIGLGWFGRDVVIPAIEESDFCRTAVVVSGSASKAEAVVEESEAERGLTYEQFHEGEAVDAYDAVYVVTPNALHLEYVETAAEFGKHVLCEKPMEATVDRAREMVSVCDEAGVTLMVAYRLQLDPAVRWLRELIRDGVVGDPAYARGTFSFYAGTDGWRFDPDLAGGGAMMDVGVYPLNTARFLLEDDPTAVSATTENPRGTAVDEHVSFQLSFPDDLTLHARASFSSHFDNALQIVGTEGILELDPAFDVNEDRTVVVRREGMTTEIEGIACNEVTEQFDYFAHCVLTGTDPVPNGRHGLVDMQVAGAVYESAETGDRIDL